jgi:hypothetical protein
MINDGNVKATGGGWGGAGIGGSYTGHGGNITISGGTITATGSPQGAGIGGGTYGSGGTITIEGGTVTATGGERGGAGVGGGLAGEGGNNTISGGTVSATGGSSGAGIGGGGQWTSGGTITIEGGTITATGGMLGAGIGGGDGGSGGNITIGGGTITATGGSSGAGIGGSGNGGAAILTIGSAATIEAYSFSSNRPAIHASNAVTTGSGFYVNANLNTAATGPLVVYANDDIDTILTTLNMPSGYRCFAFQFQGSDSPEEYNIYMKGSTGMEQIVHNDPAEVVIDKVIFSVNARNGYTGHAATNGSLNLKLGTPMFYMVTEKYVDTGGVPIFGMDDSTTSVLIGNDYSKTIPAIVGSDIQGYNDAVPITDTDFTPGDPTDISVPGNMDIYFVYEAIVYFTLYLDPTTTNGTIEWSYDGNSGTLTATGEQFREGAVVTITAIPTDSTTHGFSQWSGDHSGTTTPSTITMDGDKTIGAEFFRKYTLSLDPTTTNGTIEWSYDGNSGTLTATGEQFREGAVVTITAIPADSTTHGFSQWFGDQSGTTTPSTITMDGDKTIGAEFFRKYTLYLDPTTTNGTIGWSYDGNTGTLTAAGEQFPEGANVTIAAIPTNAVTHGFSYWFGDHGGNTISDTVTMDTEKMIGAMFYDRTNSNNYFDLDLDSLFVAAHGRIEWSVGGNVPVKLTGTVTFPAGTAVHLEVFETSPMVFSHWTGKIEAGESNPYVYERSVSITVGAAFYFDGGDENIDHIVIRLGDHFNGTITWSANGINYWDLPASGEKMFPIYTHLWLSAEGTGPYEFIHWTDDVPCAESNAYGFDGSASITVGAVFLAKHEVIVNSDGGGSFEYVITMTDPVTGDEFVYESDVFTFGAGGGTHSIYVPHGASLEVTLTSDPKGKVEWDDGSLTRKFGTEYMRTINADMEITVFQILNNGPSAWPWMLIALIGVLFLLMLLGDDDDEVYGKVRRNGKGIAGAKVAYTINGGSRKIAVTDNDGDYSISVDIGDDVVITDVSCEGAEVTDGLPMGMHITKERTNMDFDL